MNSALACNARQRARWSTVQARYRTGSFCWDRCAGRRYGNARPSRRSGNKWPTWSNASQPYPCCLIDAMENPLRQHPSLRRFAWRYLLVLTGITLFAALFWWALPIYFPELPDRILGHLDPRTLATYVLVGFIAQLIDGSLGMAYGVTSTSFLMSAGVPPALASASVHAAEVCTTGASGMSHWRFGNVDKKLFRKLALPGALGAMAGAWFLSSVDGERIKPFVAAYLLCMGGIVLKRALKGKPKVGKPRRAGLLALIGGFVDAS